jgi:hypothetical protein
LLQYSFLPQAFAATATFRADSTGSGTVNAQVPVNKIGALLLADATAFLSNNNIEVHSKSQDGNDQSVLNGTLFNTRVIGSGASRRLKGIAFFLGGGKLGDLCHKTGREDRVKTMDGQVLTGAISDVGPDGLTIGGQRVPASNLQCVDSPCAFDFEVALSGAADAAGAVTGEASRMTFSHCAVIPAAKVERERPVKTTPVAISTSTSEDKHGARVLLVTALVLGIATAIAVPVAISASHHHHHHRNRFNEQQLLEQELLLSRTQSVSSQLNSSLRNPFFP